MPPSSGQRRKTISSINMDVSADAVLGGRDSIRAVRADWRPVRGGQELAWRPVLCQWITQNRILHESDLALASPVHLECSSRELAF